MAEPTGYTKRGLFSFTPSIQIDEALPKEVQSTVTWSDKQGFIAVDTSTDPELEQGYVKLPTWGRLNNEIVEIVSLVDDPEGAGQTVVLNRGILDTLPQEHAVGSILWFAGDWIGVDPTEWTIGETVWAKAALVGPSFETPLGKVIPMPLPVAGRAALPYAPGKFQINGAYWPASVSGDLLFTWAHRDRLQQVVPGSFTGQTEGNIGPEAGVTYDLKLTDVSGGPIWADLTGLTGTSQLVLNVGQTVHGAHLHWRLYVTHSNDGDYYLNLMEMELKTSLGDVTGSGIATESTAYNGDLASDKLYDNNVGTMWHTTSGNFPQWAAYEFQSPQEIASVTIMAHNTYETRTPKDFEIQYSDNGTNWTTATTVTDSTGWSDSEVREFFLTGESGWEDGAELTVTLKAYRDGVLAYQNHEHTFISNA